MATIFVTGGAGFIGSNFIRYWLERHPDDFVINYDLLTYAGNLENLSDVLRLFPERYIFIKGDIGNYQLARHLFEEYKPEWVVNFAAESHNSRAVARANTNSARWTTSPSPRPPRWPRSGVCSRS